jgi:hypothetical protein
MVMAMGMVSNGDGNGDGNGNRAGNGEEDFDVNINNAMLSVDTTSQRYISSFLVGDNKLKKNFPSTKDSTV